MNTPKTEALLKNDDLPFWVRSACKEAMKCAPVDSLEHAQMLLEAIAEWSAVKLESENARYARICGAAKPPALEPEPQAVAA